MVERYAQGSYGMTPTKDGDFVKYQDHEHALAEKDKSYQQLMAQAVLFAGIVANDHEGNWQEEAQAFLKEMEQ